MSTIGLYGYVKKGGESRKMKTPEEIKKGLECCIGDNSIYHCIKCPYLGDEAGCGSGRRVCADILALIQQLEAQVPKWISIRDALPGLHEKVLFTPMCNEGAIYIGELNAVGERGAAYFAVRDGKRKTCYSATHWMPLPEPPKEAEYADN